MVAETSKLVKLKIGKNIPSLNAQIGDEIEVTPEMAASFRERRFLYDQVQEDDAHRKASRAKVEAETESREGTELWRIVRDLETKLQLERETSAKLGKEITDLRVALEKATKAKEHAEGELLRSKERAANPTKKEEGKKAAGPV